MNMQLAYLGLRSARRAEWIDFACSILGLDTAEQTEDGVSFRIDEIFWRILVRDGDEESLDFIGWEVPTVNQLHGLFDALERQGLGPEWADEELLADRKVAKLVAVKDPSGLRSEFFVGPRIATHWHHLGIFEQGGYVTGELGLGHIVLAVDDLSESLYFYRDLLGFRVSDHAYIPTPEGGRREVAFLHCNPRHHSIALVPAKVDLRIRHFMLELQGLDDLGRLFDRALEAGIVARSLGRHSNDKMISFYVVTPSGFQVEIGFGGLAIDGPDWYTRYYDGRPSVWGHQVIKGRTIHATD